MKPLRYWILVLLAVLLPVRGALAGAMLCPNTVSGMQVEVRLNDGQRLASPRSAMPDLAGHSHEGVHADHHETASQVDGASFTAQDRCTMCSAFCAMTPLVSTPESMALARHLVETDFPDLHLPAASFISDGQERPPRSI